MGGWRISPLLVLALIAFLSLQIGASDPVRSFDIKFCWVFSLILLIFEFYGCFVVVLRIFR